MCSASSATQLSKSRSSVTLARLQSSVRQLMISPGGGGGGPRGQQQGGGGGGSRGPQPGLGPRGPLTRSDSRARLPGIHGTLSRRQSSMSLRSQSPAVIQARVETPTPSTRNPSTNDSTHPTLPQTGISPCKVLLCIHTPSKRSMSHWMIAFLVPS